jgi:phosphoadenosine phosphosulfate reductase
MDRKELASQINEKIAKKHPLEILRYIEENYSRKAIFSTSLGSEDQALTHMIVQNAPSVKIFTLDTGRIFPETYETIEATNKKYKINIDIYFPDNKEVEKMVNEKGINLFYQSIENRKLCCFVRKTQSIKRALQGYDFWITGIRKDQSVTRFFNQYAEFDEGNQIIKINPLLDWREKDVWDYIKKNEIPYNKLHDKGFPSIGCQPCTRAIEKGEDVRAGRWWWESPEHKECGLHNQK